MSKREYLLIVITLLLVSGCSSVIEGESRRFADNFSLAVQENDDPQLVAEAMPSYLLLLDALVRNSPEQTALWQAAATLNSAYAGNFITDKERAKALNQKALDYAFKALCQTDARLCKPRELTVVDLQAILAKIDKEHVPILFTAGSVWAGWIQANSEDWNAVADLSRVEAIMQRIVELDESYQQGAAHLYLGVLATVLTPALGGRPEVGKQHFERALLLSQNQNLMVKVYYAKNYARGIFDRELHDRLLQEVLSADPHAPHLTLSNRLAQQEARQLLKTADDYF